MSINGVLFTGEACVDALADIAIRLAPIITITPSAKNNPTNLMECLAVKRRVMTFTAPITILFAINFPAIVA